MGQARSAVSALTLAAVCSAVVAAVASAPAAWLQPELELPAQSTGPVAATIDRLATGLPIGQLGQRPQIAAVGMVMAIAFAASSVAHRLFRGPGRLWGAVVTGPLVTWSLLHWLSVQAPVRPVHDLAFTLFATLAMGVLVRPMVRIGRIDVSAGVRMLTWGTMATLVAPRPGLPLLLGLATVLAIRLRWPHRSAPRPPSETRSRIPWGSFALTCSLTVVLPLAAIWALAPPDLQLHGLELQWPSLRILHRHLSPYLVIPGLVLIGLLILPLRWRGGLELATLVGIGLVIHHHGGLLAPVPTLLVACATAAAGWVWLAGSVAPRHSHLGMALALVAAFGVLGLELQRGWKSRLGVDLQPVSHLRPTASLQRLYGRGLLAPGDVLITVQPWLRTSLLQLQAAEGFRPDVTIVDPESMSDTELTVAAMGWAAEGRRVLSGSFNLAGRWRPEWAIDSGPLFWFIGTAGKDQHEFIQLPGGEQTPQNRLRERLHVERARFRRARGAPEKAAAALLFLGPDQRELLQTHERDIGLRPQAEPPTELPPVPVSDDYVTGALTLAEAGDLLYASGSEALGTELLLLSAERGFAPAWATLARWQLRAGRDRAARETLDAIAMDTDLRPQALELLRWLVERDRLLEARAFQDRFTPSESAVADEIAARLELLRTTTRRDRLAE